MIKKEIYFLSNLRLNNRVIQKGGIVMLFGSKKDKKKQESKTTDASNMETVIGENTELEGTLTIEGSLRIDGVINGKLKAKGDVVVGKSGTLEADIEARNVTIAGDVTGNVMTENKLVITSTGKLIGDIKIANLIIEDGAVFKGKSESKSATVKRFTDSTEGQNDKQGSKESKEVKDTSKSKDNSQNKGTKKSGSKKQESNKNQKKK
ncbi:protein of unknown function DUF583 [Acetohalobium arabaticum DSM 5501]|uniref:Integral membrane protein CcmA involved in cell shape determination n=2 Tax=Acetohalobium TaxID=28186 RepID=D9QUL7_ACEAZ|nr:protein of unknown function DUF583 [Acetohalobium arabaticum DSM 5501]